MPQPVDFHTEAAKAYSAQRAMQIAQQALEAAQARVAMQSRQEAQAAASQVGQPQETEHEGVDSEGRRRESRQHNPPSKKRDGESGGTESEHIVQHSEDGEPHLDVSI